MEFTIFALIVIVIVLAVKVNNLSKMSVSGNSKNNRTTLNVRLRKNSTDIESVKNCLASAIKNRTPQMQQYLLSNKRKVNEIKRKDFLWHYLLQSFSTMGRSSGYYGLIEEKSNYTEVTYERIDKLEARKRIETVAKVCRAAKVRMPDKKAEYIIGCYEYVKSLGGPEKAKEILLSLKGREEKINFLKRFPGIGDKYARNIMMDVYHKDFRDCIAIDARIKKISSTLGLKFNNYREHEKFYLDVAKLAEINGWELDRLLYGFQKEILEKVRAR